MPSKENQEEYLSKSRIKEDYGFSDAMIRDLLPKPELTKPNPMYRTAGSPMKLWKKSTVEKVVAMDEFTVAFEKRKKRGQRAEAVAQVKKEKTLAEFLAKANSIAVHKIPLEELRERTIKDKDTVEHAKGDFCFCAKDAPDYVMNRWMVNFVRHNLTAYDSDIYKMRNKVGIHEGYGAYKNAVLNKIAEAYPELAEECDNQKVSASCRTEKP